MPAEGGSAELVTKAPVFFYRWSHDGSRIYFSGVNRGSNDLWEIRVSDGRERRVTRFVQRNGRPGELALAATKTHLYFTWRNDVGDIWVMDAVPASDR
jgi:Tol biopolymer transport system component